MRLRLPTPGRAALKRRTLEDVIVDAVVWIVMIGFSISVIYPFWTMLIDSFSTPENVYSLGFRLWPRPATIEAYRDVLSKDTVGIAYYNTVLRTVAGTLVTLFVSFSAAYALARRTLPLNKTITLLMIFTMFFSGGLIATYLWMGQIGLHNNRLALILPPAASAYYIIIMRNFFRAIPPELEESAFMDGASAYTVLLRIIVPVSMPVVATIALWSAVFHWDSWFDALLYTPKREQLVLQLMLRRILIEHQASNLFDLSVDELESSFVVETIKAATLYIAIGPIILLYPFLQRYFVKGIMTGSLKG
ncbi:MAG: carbohydrate ABC transporter permease [Spirochaetaceae bacterium]|nr:carbohydrate ABC transporter permease [Spirochaetaceae bacterium]